AILPAEGGGDGAVMKSCLRVEIEFCGPPGFRSVLKFKPIRMEVVAAALRTVGREILDLQISGLLEELVIGNDVRLFLRTRGTRQQHTTKSKKSNRSGAVREPGHEFSLKMSCNGEIRLI